MTNSVHPIYLLCRLNELIYITRLEQCLTHEHNLSITCFFVCLFTISIGHKAQVFTENFLVVLVRMNDMEGNGNCWWVEQY